MTETNKLTMADMATVAGGTARECKELNGLFDKGYVTARLKEEGKFKWRFCDSMEDILSDLGIEAHMDWGFLSLGIGSKNNTYRDKETNQMLLHSDVVSYLKTGVKSWRS